MGLCKKLITAHITLYRLFQRLNIDIGDGLLLIQHASPDFDFLHSQNHNVQCFTHSNHRKILLH